MSTIPAGDLPLITPGNFDTVIGVDEATKATRRFALSNMPMGTAAESRIAALEAGQDAAMLGFATKAAMDADTAQPAGTLALVTNDTTPANNGTYRWNGTAWTLSADRVTGLEGRVSTAEDYLLTADRVRASANILNQEGATFGKSISTADGAMFNKADWYASDYLPVEPSTVYKRSESDAWAQFDANKVFISGGINPSFTTTANTAYVRVGYSAASAGTHMIAARDEYPLSYEPYTSVVDVPDLVPSIAAIREPLVWRGPYGMKENWHLRPEIKVGAESAAFLIRDSINMFDKDAVAAGRRPAGDGSIAVQVGMNLSEFMPADPLTTYSATTLSYLHEYNAAKQFLRYRAPGGTTFTTGADTAFIRMSVTDANLPSMMFAQAATLPSFEPYHRYNIDPIINVNAAGTISKWAGLKWNALGDSITEGVSGTVPYPATLGTDMDFDTVRNYGVGGTAIAVRASPWDTNAMCIRYADMDNDADLITVAGGTNDFGTSVALGTFASTATNTFYGALHTLCAGLVAKYPTKSIIFFTPIPRYNMNTANGQGLLFAAYVDAIIEVCEYYAIPVIDLFRSTQFRPWNEDNKTAIIPDGLHPNNTGYAHMVDVLRPRLDAL